MINAVTVANFCGPDSKKVRKRIIDLNGISQLLNVCKNKNDRIQEAGILGITNLASDSDDLRCKIIDDPNLIPAIESILLSNNEKSFDHVTSLLFKLTFGI